MKNIDDARLYLVLDRQVNEYEQLFEILEKAVKAGVDIVQLRDKKGTARDVLEFSKKAVKISAGRIPFIVNDRIDIAIASGADGVHLGQDDVPVKEARNIVGDKLFIGASCQTLEQAIEAQENGADYIGFGSVFKTSTKPDRNEMDMTLLSRVMDSISIPVFAIGGIDLDNVNDVLNIGANRVAVTRSISLAEDVSAATEKFKELLA